jgi:serine/threonine protein kinase/Flp pilus assembly protein TadD
VTLATGSRLGPYEIVSPIGAGGMGEVYRARDSRLGRDVAIKVLPASFSNDPDRLRRFEHEARAAGILNHPNITAVYDVGTVGDAPYVVSELLEGETLRSRLAGGALAPRRAIDYALQIAHGLAAAHEKGIVHRDLKPENLFVTKDGRVKILDFGLAKLTQPEKAGPQTNLPTETAGTEPGVVMGTLGYMSPEQVRGKPADARSDIFSFGAILYEMLSGRRAFHGDSAADTMSAILREEPAELSATNQQVPPALDRVVRRCLEKSPEQRFQSARDIAYALDETLAGATASAAPAPLPPPRSRRLRWLALLAASLAAALAVLVVADAGGLRRRLFGASSREIHSLAVLPLENLSRDAAQEYFADGMTEALITDLAQIGSLRVISRTSAMRYKGTKKGLPEIARELDVDGVVEGSVLRAGNRIRITAQLIHASTDRHLWARSYERDFKDVLALQDEVAQAIAGQIQARLTSDEQARLSRARPVNPEALDAYLKGRYEWWRWRPENYRKALEYFRQAIAIDPSYAPAYAGLALTYARLGDSAWRPGDAYPKAKSAALRAVELDPELGEAHVALGMSILWNDWDWAAAERELRRGIDLDPRSTDAHMAYSSFLANMGRREEAVVQVNRAHELDPLSATIRGQKANRLMSAERYEEAIEEAKSALELDPTAIQARTILGRAYLQKGKVGPAIAELERTVDLSRREVGPVAWLGYAYGVAGQKEKAEAVLRELQQRFQEGYVAPPLVALVFLGLGERDRAFEWLEKGYALRDSLIVRLNAMREFDVLRSDPRFVDLIRRIGLPSEKRGG